jgi:diaminohydroxyphosphoribosylaminopyrimidine deaminase / 5-amino-6-(5-phosphoribosylamino)uracil reductase
VGALIVKDNTVLARGWTGAGGRPHAEAAALEAAGAATRGATLYVTLEPCAHASPRGPACADLVAASGLARVVVGCGDPDPRTAGAGIVRIREAGIAVELAQNPACAAGLTGYLTRTRLGRPHVTLKLALSQDGRLARAPGEPRWLTGEIARAHTHAWRAKMDAILVGRGTFEADSPKLDVRLPGLEDRSPQRWLLTRGEAPEALASLLPAQYLMVEGGAKTARAILAAGLVDRLMLYRAPLTLGGDLPALPDLTEARLAESPVWNRIDHRQLGNDTLDVYDLA